MTPSGRVGHFCFMPRAGSEPGRVALLSGSMAGAMCEPGHRRPLTPCRNTPIFNITHQNYIYSITHPPSLVPSLSHSPFLGYLLLCQGGIKHPLLLFFQPLNSCWKHVPLCAFQRQISHYNGYVSVLRWYYAT
jgi:hypothetical protein